MKTELKAKYLFHLTKKNKEKGFTLIELLVVIIIVGVLAAIALPSFLNQIGKARGSEAKSALGTINRSQQAYRYEQNTFATQISLLDADITPKFYTYEVEVAGDSFVSTNTTTTQADLKGYSGAAEQTDSQTFRQLICESVDPISDTATPNVEATAPNAIDTCPTDYRIVQ